MSCAIIKSTQSSIITNTYKVLVLEANIVGDSETAMVTAMPAANRYNKIRVFLVLPYKKYMEIIILIHIQKKITKYILTL